MPLAPDGSEFVQVSAKELRQLREDVKKLAALEAGGVDNWEWYEDSLNDAGFFDEEDE